MEQFTKNKKNAYDMLAMMTKALKKHRIDIAAWCAYELYPSHSKEIWNELIDFTDEECMKQEFRAMQVADKFINRNGKNTWFDPIFIAKALVLLSVDKSEDRNGVNPIQEGYVKVDVVKDRRLTNDQIPDWVFDCHTLKGKRMGRTDLDMTITEQAALSPLRKTFFDNCSWYNSYYDDFKQGKIDEKEWKRCLEFAEGRTVK